MCDSPTFIRFAAPNGPPPFLKKERPWNRALPGSRMGLSFIKSFWETSRPGRALAEFDSSEICPIPEREVGAVSPHPDPLPQEREQRAWRRGKPRGLDCSLGREWFTLSQREKGEGQGEGKETSRHMEAPFASSPHGGVSGGLVPGESRRSCARRPAGIARRHSPALPVSARQAPRVRAGEITKRQPHVRRRRKERAARSETARRGHHVRS